MSCEDSIEFVKHRKGTSLDRGYSLDTGGSVAEWTCQLQVRRVSDDTAIVDRAITATNIGITEFQAIVTGAELDIDDGRYIVAAQLSNASTGEVLESVEGIYITREWVY